MSIYFDGVDDYIAVTDDGRFQLSDKVTVMCWLYGLDFSSERFAVNKYNQTFAIEVFASGTIRFTTNDVEGLPSALDSGVTPEVKKWYHVAGTYDKDGGDENKKIYVNGVLKATDTNSNALELASDPLYIGAFSDTSYRWIGWVSNVMVFNRVLNQNEIKNYMVGYRPVTPDMVFHSLLEKGADGKIIDLATRQGYSVTGATNVDPNGLHYSTPISR